MATRGALSPYLPAKPMTAEQRALFDQYMRLAYQRAGLAQKKYGHQPRLLLKNAALIGLMYAAVRYDPAAPASFATFATHSIDWTIGNIVQADMGLKRLKRKRKSANPHERFEPSAYRACGEMPEAFFDTTAEQQVLVDRRTPEEVLEERDREQRARDILTTLEQEVNRREVEMLKRHLAGEPLARIAKDYNVSRERVRQLVARTIAKAKTLLAA